MDAAPLAVGGLLLVVVVVGILAIGILVVVGVFASRKRRAPEMAALVQELADLRDEIDRLREENAALRAKLSAGSTAIKQGDT